MNYEGSLYRPPSEARSFILQATIGCSHNDCTFCNMYKAKEFRIKKIEEILEDIYEARSLYQKVEKIFIADGDALIIKTKDLLVILKELNKVFPEVKSIGIYSSPKSIHKKTLSELKELKEAGLKIAYLGLESGSDRILKLVNKGDDARGIIEAGLKIKEASILLSLTVISGLGGKEFWRDHILETAKAINKIKPDYLGLLTLMLEPGTEIFNAYTRGEFKTLNPIEVAEETLLLLENLDSEGTVFRSNHASNYVSLRGTLNKDRESMILELKDALNDSDFKEEWLRRL